jgi:MFS family permease
VLGEPAAGLFDLRLSLDATNPRQLIIDTFARLQLLVDLEEMLDLQPLEIRNVDDVAQALLAGVARRNTQHLVVATVLVDHQKQPNRSTPDNTAGKRGCTDKHQRIQRITVQSQSALDEAIISRIGGRGKQRAIQPDAAGPVIHFVLGMLGFDAGWRLMFFVEGLPAILCGVLVLVLLPSRPRHAKWLTEQESSALEVHIAAEDAREVGTEMRTRAALTNPRVIALSIIYFGIVFGLYVLAFFLPLVINGFQQQFHVRLSLVEIGLITAVPYVFASVAMVAWARHSDRSGERAGHVALAAFVGAVAIAATLYMNSPLLVMACITACVIGVYAAAPVFWQLPNAFLTGVGAAAGIALINSFGNPSGFVGPYLTGWLHHLTGSFRAGLWVVAGFMALAGVIALSFRTIDQRSPQDMTAAPQESI